MAVYRTTPGSHEPQTERHSGEGLALPGAEARNDSALQAYEPGNIESYLAQLTDSPPTEQGSLFSGGSVDIFPFELGEARDPEAREDKGVPASERAPSWLAHQKTPRSAFASPPLEFKASIPTPQFCEGDIEFCERTTTMYTLAKVAMLRVRSERERKRRGELRTSKQRRQYRLDKLRRDLLRCQLEDCRDRDAVVTGMTLISTHGLSDSSDSGPGTPLDEQRSEDGEWSEPDIVEEFSHLKVTDAENNNHEVTDNARLLSSNAEEDDNW